MCQKFIILGNGFTIDFLKNIKETEKVNVNNLFSKGEKVPWPGNDKAGFLSYKHCPNLWNLGARPNMDAQASIELVEDVITCANILQEDNRNENNIYIKAYKELASYLFALFNHYDKMVDVPNSNLNEWAWSKYFQSVSADDNISCVYIVTLNYDIWLERFLQKMNIDFDIIGLNEHGNKFKIFKPHGSISFVHQVKKVKEDFKIDYDSDINSSEITDFTIKYNGIESLNKINAIIPPAGDSSRLNLKWANTIRDKVKSAAKSITEKDELIFCGISYWHVDRVELDSILTLINPNISNVKVINPNPPRVLNAVMTTLFKNVIFYCESESINL